MSFWDTTSTSEIVKLMPAAGKKENNVLKPALTDLHFTKIEMEEDKNGNPYLAVVLTQDKTKAVYQKNFFNVDPEKASAATIAKITVAQIKHIFGILSGIDYGLEENKIVADDFEDFCDQILKTLPADWKQIKIDWVKLIYNKDKDGNYTVEGYPSFPPFLSSEKSPRIYQENHKGEYADRFVPEIKNARSSEAPKPDEEATGSMIDETGDDELV